MTTALIVGSGVCGPVTAMALQRAGIEATVYEAREPTSEEVGSYLTVATNGLDALRAIDADTRVLSAGFPTSAIVLSSGTGKRLGTVPIGTASTESRTVKRAHLQRVLQDEATRRGIRFEFGRRLVGAAPTRDGVVARFLDGSDAVGTILIGCDGVHSVTRRIIDPAAPAPRYVGLLNFGGYTSSIAAGETGVWHMIFGRRAFFGYAVDPRGGTVWFANVPRRPSTREERSAMTDDQWKQQLVELFAEDRGPAVDLISAGILELAADNTHDLPSVPTWHRAPLIVIGDAAHAPSPTSGQGASLAIEDAVLLAKCLRDIDMIPKAFETFERLRRRRVERIVAEGARGSSRKAVGPAGRFLRDLLLPIVFKYVVTKASLAWMYDHHIEWHEQVVAGPAA
jgi:2-polyprenyl-6-methoxyphenol hydroxylase-like FAD-dependent oxidoreductase